MEFNQSPPNSARTVGVFFDDGHWCQAWWSGEAWRSTEANKKGGGFRKREAEGIAGWLEMRDAIQVAKARRAQKEAA